jgi:hypothetical protein
MMMFFSTCHDTIRTPAALQHDIARPEDVDTSGEDHAADGMWMRRLTMRGAVAKMV